MKRNNKSKKRSQKSTTQSNWRRSANLGNKISDLKSLMHISVSEEIFKKTIHMNCQKLKLQEMMSFYSIILFLWNY